MKRLQALDVMRGLTIALMIMVNTPGSWQYIYPPLRHAKWHGCTPTDLVFPFFLFIVGTAMWYSFRKHEGLLKHQQVFKVLKRMTVIFLIGLLLNAYPYFDFSKLRIMGVLQRIALAYGIAAFLIMYVKRSYLYVLAVCILIGYWFVLYVGGTPPYAAESNLVGKIDAFLLGKQHIWKGLGFSFDPEGLLSTLPATVTVLVGYFAGAIVGRSENVQKGIWKLLLFGVVLTFTGRLWGLILPINKSLWTSSYVLYTGGLAILLLALLLWLIDVKNYRKWTQPFVHFGMNPLFIFVLSGLYVKTIVYFIKIDSGGETLSGYTYLYEIFFVPIAGNMNGSLLFALSHIFVFWLIVYVLYRKRVFIKI